MNVEEYFREKGEIVNSSLDKFLPSEKGPPEDLHRAMRYAVFSGGKRLRPVLVIAASEALGGSTEEVLKAACAIELIHNYSLIHDDLPAMDDDDYRRGKPTVHKAFGEAVALLAGNALLVKAFELLGEYGDGVLHKLLHEVAGAIGDAGMIGGQAEELSVGGEKISSAALEQVYSLKTAALISLAVRIGGIIAGATEAEVKTLSSYGDKVGLAFQIVDDLLDDDEAELSYQALVDVDGAKRRAKELIDEAKGALARFGGGADTLRGIADFVVERSY